jgi:cobyrinic acid a,c-diamide synthase
MHKWYNQNLLNKSVQMSIMVIPRVVVAGGQSGVGKTTISIGLMGALNAAGFKVQGFKVGPDYIDPSYHNAVTGRLSENLDVWLAPKDQIVEVFARAMDGADFAVIEGVMGLYDSVSGTDETGSTAQIAKLLNCPVLLVLDVHNTVRSAAALTLGFKEFDKDVNIKGVILNNVAGETHARWCKDAIGSATGLPVVGWLPVNGKIKLLERHLGLVPTPEEEGLKSFLPEITSFVAAHVDLNEVVNIAKSAGKMPRIEKPIFPKHAAAKKVAVAVAFDEAFNFYYPGNLSLLEAFGAEIKRFSPIHDQTLPSDVAGLYIGGGFPEMFLKELEENEAMREAILEAALGGMPVYGECAGLMYLTDEIADFTGKSFRMVGALHGKTIMTKNTLVTYSLAKVANDNILCSPGSTVKGHEFHNSVITGIPADSRFAYEMEMGEGIVDKKDGWVSGNVLASYMHIHFAQDPEIARNFLRNCQAKKK